MMKILICKLIFLSIFKFHISVICRETSDIQWINIEQNSFSINFIQTNFGLNRIIFRGKHDLGKENHFG